MWVYNCPRITVERFWWDERSCLSEVSVFYLGVVIRADMSVKVCERLPDALQWDMVGATEVWRTRQCPRYHCAMVSLAKKGVTWQLILMKYHKIYWLLPLSIYYSLLIILTGRTKLFSVTEMPHKSSITCPTVSNRNLGTVGRIAATHRGISGWSPSVSIENSKYPEEIFLFPLSFCSWHDF